MQRAVGAGITVPVAGAGSTVVLGAVGVCNLEKDVRGVDVIVGTW